uniref:Transposase n=1 Tax=Candidatus Kentrum sp. TUN TaxID=2126343 RepID=A0A451A521_9GAMM|nr:MAG: Transposase [Candidatus Kentron sp. TUN]
MPHYSEEFKEKLVREMMSPGGRSVSEIHQASGISENTLYSWKNKYGVEQEAEPGRAAVISHIIPPLISQDISQSSKTNFSH